MCSKYKTLAVCSVKGTLLILLYSLAFQNKVNLWYLFPSSSSFPSNLLCGMFAKRKQSIWLGLFFRIWLSLLNVSLFWKAGPKSRGDKEDLKLQKKQVANGSMWSFFLLAGVDVVGWWWERGWDGKRQRWKDSNIFHKIKTTHPVLKHCATRT